MNSRKFRDQAGTTLTYGEDRLRLFGAVNLGKAGPSRPFAVLVSPLDPESFSLAPNSVFIDQPR